MRNMEIKLPRFDFKYWLPFQLVRVTQSCILLALALLGLMTASGLASTQPMCISTPQALQGDSKLKGGHYLLTGLQGDYEVHDIVDYIRDNIDAGAADTLDGLLQADGLGFAEIYDVPGASDATTIAIATIDVPLWKAALVTIHELGHVLSARAAALSTNDPYETDPNTKGSAEGGTPCGYCAHAQMFAALTTHFDKLCEVLGPSELKELCEVFKGRYKAASELLTMCSYDGCPNVPALSAIMSFPCNCKP